MICYITLCNTNNLHEGGNGTKKNVIYCSSMMTRLTIVVSSKSPCHSFINSIGDWIYDNVSWINLLWMATLDAIFVCSYCVFNVSHVTLEVFNYLIINICWSLCQLVPWIPSTSKLYVKHYIFDTLGSSSNPSTIPQISFLINNICSLIDQVL